MKVTGKLVLISGDLSLAKFVAASEEGRAQMLHYYVGDDSAMPTCWVQVGTFEATINLTLAEDVMKRAVGIVQDQLSQAEYHYTAAVKKAEDHYTTTVQELTARLEGLKHLKGSENV